MKRLTMHTSNGACLIINADNEQDARQKLMEKFKETCNRLAELEDKLENGMLIELPCKEGDTIYRIIHARDKYGFYTDKLEVADRWKIVEIIIYQDDIHFIDDSGNEFLINDIDKTVFLSREEAEKALYIMNEK